MSSAAVDLVCEIGARLRQTNLLVSARVTRNINEEMDKTLTFGQRVADRFAAEQDFKVNLKSELMLGELTRHGERARRTDGRVNQRHPSRYRAR